MEWDVVDVKTIAPLALRVQFSTGATAAAPSRIDGGDWGKGLAGDPLPPQRTGYPDEREKIASTRTGCPG